MRKILFTMIFTVFMLFPLLLWAGDDTTQATKVLMKYFKKCGGIEKIKSIKNVTLTSQLEAYQYASTYTLSADGKFRIEEPNRIIIFDGQDYWQTFFGMVDRVGDDQIENYQQVSLYNILFVGLLDQEGKPIEAEYVGKEEQHGHKYEVIKTVTADGRDRTYYFNRKNGFLEKMIELVEDPDYFQLKNISRFSNYENHGDVKIFTSSETICVTNGNNIRPAMNFTNIKMNQDLEESLFTKPEHSVPNATIAITGEIIGFSNYGSAILNITDDLFQKLDPQNGSLFTVKIKDNENVYRYIEDITSALDIENGEYILVFNNTPALWAVKAYVGLRNELEGVEVGEPVTIVPAEPQENEQ